MEIETTQKSKKKEKKAESKAKKSKKTKEYKTKMDDGFTKPKTSSEIAIEKKIDRINRKNQIRRQKINQ